MHIHRFTAAVFAAGLMTACATTATNIPDDPVRKLIRGTCPDSSVMTVTVPNMYWEPVAQATPPGGWCEHHMFRHKTRIAGIGIGLLPSPHNAVEFADALASQHPEYDMKTGEGTLMDRGQAEDGRSWAFVHVQIPGANGPDRVFTAFLKDDRLPDHVVVVTGLWPAGDNKGLVFDLTDFAKNIDIDTK